MPPTASISASMIGGGTSPPETSVMDIDTPGGRPVTLRVRWLFFCRFTRSRRAHAKQTYSSSSPLLMAVSASC